MRVGVFFALANFLATAAIGAFLRFNNVFPMPQFSVRNWIHAHSHTGFLGWVFMALAVLTFGMLLPKTSKLNRRMYRLLIYLQIAVIGMLATFPLMGYAAPSIIFSTFHIILTLLFVILFFKHASKSDLSSKFMKAALVFMLISGLGPLALGPIMVFGFKGTPVYDMAIYFYLHFQYNGWFSLAVFALLFKLIEDWGINTEPNGGKLVLRLLIYSTILTLALSALGFSDSPYVRWVGFIGAGLQLWAGFILLKLLFVKVRITPYLTNGWVKWSFGIALFSWLLKIMMQFLSAFPFITEFAYFNREAIMTYLHLSFLGFTTCFIIGVFIYKNYLSTSGSISRIGLGVFLGTIILMELTLGLKSLPQLLTVELFKILNISLFIESALLFGSVLILLFYSFILPTRSRKRRRYV